MFRYWGKADPKYAGEPKWHPLVYHSLDVKIDDKTIRVDGYRTWRQHFGRKGIELATVDFEGILEVTDSARFVDALMQGVGPAKAFGCGLMLVRRL